MKPFLFSRKIYAQIALCSLTAFLIVAGCKKKELVEFSTDLAINSRIVKLNEAAATTRVQVYADGSWDLSTAANEWLTLDKTNGSGKSDFVATVTSNKGNLPRALTIYIKGGGKTDSVTIQQRGLTPTLNIIDPNMNALSNPTKMNTVLTTNIPFAEMKKEVVYTTAGESNWISNLAFDGKYLSLNVAEITSSTKREAYVKLSYLDAMGTTVKDSILVKQSPKSEYQNAVARDFAYVKALPVGVVTEDIYLEGIVLSDKGNPNTAQNPNTANNKHTIDKTENAITVYVQNVNGTSGIKLRMATPGDHVFNKNEKIKVWLKNTTISKTSSPATVTISNIPSTNVIEKVANTTPLVARELYMKDLVDNDVYTLVKLKDVEISVPSGSYSNVNEGYEFRVDCYAQNIRDVDGNSMYMMTNNDVPYRRTGVQVPQGSGTISGVLVHEVHARYGGNIGKYAIRHMDESDINLQKDRNNGFSNILVEWDRFRNELQTGATLASNPLTPSIGSGTLRHTDFADLNYTAAAGIYGTNDFNALIPDPTGAKGAVTNGAVATRGLWNTSKNRGGGIVMKVSTANINKQLSLQLEGHVAQGAPRTYQVEWSNQANMDAGTWTLVQEFTFQDVVNWTSTLLTQTSGYKVVNINLPTATLGLNDLFIRVKAKNRTVGSPTAETGGTFNAAVAVYFGHISIKYNK